MTALKKLLDFADTLPNNKGIEFLQLLQGYQKEMIAEKTELIEGYERIIRGTQDTPQSERIGQDMARLGNYEVVAVAGTADMLLGEINVGDTVELNPNVKPTEYDNEYLILDKDIIKSLNTVTDKITFSNVLNVKVNKDSYWHSARLFRKVSTPLSNPIKTTEGC